MFYEIYDRGKFLMSLIKGRSLAAKEKKINIGIKSDIFHPRQVEQQQQQHFEDI
jgi:hypothetical protein